MDEPQLDQIRNRIEEGWRSAERGELIDEISVRRWMKVRKAEWLEQRRDR